MSLREWIRRLRRALLGTRAPQGDLGVRILGHRRYVGGRWEEMGRLQLDFMVGQGLRPDHVFLDVACGSLRAGRLFVDYLEPGHYLGIEKEARLVEAGLEKELDATVVSHKRPEIVVSDSFAFDRLSKVPDMALANSLFTHLDEDTIRLCLERLGAFVDPGHAFFATFFEGAASDNPDEPHDHGHFRYPREALSALGEEIGWRATYVGEWGHPRRQVMMRFDAQ